MEVRWKLEDGMAHSAKFSFQIDDSELEGYEGEALQAKIEEYVQDEFNDKISWYIISVDGKPLEDL